MPGQTGSTQSVTARDAKTASASNRATPKRKITVGPPKQSKAAPATAPATTKAAVGPPKTAPAPATTKATVGPPKGSKAAPAPVPAPAPATTKMEGKKPRKWGLVKKKLIADNKPKSGASAVLSQWAKVAKRPAGPNDDWVPISEEAVLKIKKAAQLAVFTSFTADKVKELQVILQGTLERKVAENWERRYSL